MYSIIFQSNKEGAKRFKRWITNEVIPSIRKKGYYGIPSDEGPFVTHDFARRYNLNWDRVDKGYFSVISELYYFLYGFFEMKGVRIPDKYYNKDIPKHLRPDISVGKGFPEYFTKNYPNEYKKYEPKKYSHLLQEGFEIECYQYPREVHYIFVEYMQEEWIPKNATAYFQSRLSNDEYMKIDNVIKGLPSLKNK